MPDEPKWKTAMDATPREEHALAPGPPPMSTPNLQRVLDDGGDMVVDGCAPLGFQVTLLRRDGSRILRSVVAEPIDALGMLAHVERALGPAYPASDPRMN